MRGVNTLEVDVADLGRGDKPEQVREHLMISPRITKAVSPNSRTNIGWCLPRTSRSPQKSLSESVMAKKSSTVAGTGSTAPSYFMVVLA